MCHYVLAQIFEETANNYEFVFFTRTIVAILTQTFNIYHFYEKTFTKSLDNKCKQSWNCGIDTQISILLQIHILEL